ncbi:histidinol-phosphatase HisJ family protein [Guggenheimella bovis]
MIFDTHLHSYFSTDSRTKPEELIKASETIGITITDHQDVRDSYRKPYCHDPKAFFEAYEPIRSDKLLLGVEIGMTKDALEFLKDDMKSYPYDFLLGSVHSLYVGGPPDGYSNDIVFESKDPVEAQRQYVKGVIRAIEDFFPIDALAHLDYVCRYSDIPGKDFYVEELREDLLTLFKLLVEKEVSLEVNTYRFKNPHALTEWKLLLSYYKECGGEHVTLGSDAHLAMHIGRHFDTALELIESVGLTPCYYKMRKKIEIR